MIMRLVLLLVILFPFTFCVAGCGPKGGGSATPSAAAKSQQESDYLKQSKQSGAIKGPGAAPTPVPAKK